jgi:two-component system cell cycle response regulator DivK
MSEKPPRILIVEDNQDNRMLLMDMLDALNYEAIEAVDGVEGVEIAIREKPSLILLDLSLPRKDGWQAARELKANAEVSHIPIIALTAHAMVGDRDRALEAGCDDYLSKPISLADLTRKIASHLGGAADS